MHSSKNLRQPETHGERPVARRSRVQGFTLTELAVSIAVAGVISVSAVTGLLWANRTAAIDRARSCARALCQDRVEQALSEPFAPPATVPTIFGAWPIPSTDTVTTTETVPVYAEAGGASTIDGTRTVIVSRPDTTLNHALVTVRVDYVYRGQNYRQEINTVRSPD